MAPLSLRYLKSMSISNDSSQVELIASSDTTVTTPADIDVIPNDDLSITGRKSEYSIIGDGIYASVSTGPAPVWLTQVIDSVISAALGNVMSDMSNANANVLQAIREIEAARNTYDEQINIVDTIDGRIVSHLETLNASIDGVNNSVAEIKNLQTVFVTEDQAMALSGSVIEASLNTPGGVIKGAVDSLQSVVATLEGTVATNYDRVIAQMDDTSAIIQQELTALANEDMALAQSITNLSVSMGDIEATISQEMVAFATDDGNAGARFKINLETAGVKDPDGNPSTLIGGLILESDGQAVSGGFDVDNFWLGRAGSNGQHPFAIQGNDIYFNGKVSFNSVTDVPQLGSTPEEVVTAINNGDTTTIDGGKIATGSITADQIATNSITADEIDATNLVVKHINVGTGATGARLEITDTLIKVYDTSGNLRVRLGVW